MFVTWYARKLRYISWGHAMKLRRYVFIGSFLLAVAGGYSLYSYGLKGLQETADAGNVFAQDILEQIYFHGYGLSELRESAEAGNVFAQRALGDHYSTGGFMYCSGCLPRDPAKAEKWWLKAAEQGDARAQTHLGFLYRGGYGVPEDGAEAEKWFRRAAEQGVVRAQFRLGDMYGRGQGVPVDAAEAARWLRRAAEQDSAAGKYKVGFSVLAQYRLGLMYEKGQGVSRDYVMAHMWLNLAAVRGYQVASSNRDRIANKMTQTQISEAQRLAREWKPKTK